MNNFHLAGMLSGVSGDSEKPTTAHWGSGMQNISATSSLVCTKHELGCVILITTSQSLPLGVHNGNTLKTDSTWKALQLRKPLRLPVVQKSDNTLQENHRLTTGIQNLHSISHTPSTYLANRAVHSSSLQAQTTDIPVLLKIPPRGATMGPPLSALASHTPVKATIKVILLQDRGRWTSSRDSLGK